MIFVTKDGRRFSELTAEEIEEELHNSVDNLTDDERALLAACLEELAYGNDDLLSLIAEHKYKYKPVSIEQFLEDPYYLGISCETLYPKLKEDIIELFTGNYKEVLLVGSIGWGKTTFYSVAMARVLYELSCLVSPQVSFGLSPGSEMALVLVSKNLPLSRNVLKSSLDDKLKLSPYFNEMWHPNFGRDVTQFPDHVHVTVASYRSDRLLGENVFAAALDEANFAMAGSKIITKAMGQEGDTAQYDLAEKVYTQLSRRIKSRFQRAGGDVPGMIILLSSAGTIDSFMDRRLKEAINEPRVFIREYATWDVKPDTYFSGKKFRVLCGSSSLKSRILDDDEYIDESMLDDGARIIEVPEEYRRDFELDLENAIRDIAGVSTLAISQFIDHVEKIEQCVVDHLEHPFSEEVWTFGEPAKFIWDRICVLKERRLPDGYIEKYWEPKFNKNALRCIHVDVGLTEDSLGIAMGHVDRMVEVVRRSPDGDLYKDLAPFIVIDFVLKVVPPIGDQIILSDIRRLIYALYDHGFVITKITFDSFQSVDSIQMLRQKGFNAGKLSLDTDVTGYELLRAALYEQRIEMYRYLPLISELKKLEVIYSKGHKKVDHPKGGSKDVSDAVAGVVYSLVNDVARRLPVRSKSDTRVGGDAGDRWVTGKVQIDGKVDIDTLRALKDDDDDEGPLPMPFL